MEFFFFNDTATTEIYTLSLHDALPICTLRRHGRLRDSLDSYLTSYELEPATLRSAAMLGDTYEQVGRPDLARSEEHTSELQSPDHLVCRLLLEKKNLLQKAKHSNSPTC